MPRRGPSRKLGWSFGARLKGRPRKPWSIRGTLHRLTLTLLAEEGADLQLDVTAFVPDAGYENVPDLPSILDLHSCLERVRFACDPATDTFYFGPASLAG